MNGRRTMKKGQKRGESGIRGWGKGDKGVRGEWGC